MTIPPINATAKIRRDFETWLTGKCNRWIRVGDGYQIENVKGDFFSADPTEEVDFLNNRVTKTRQK